MKIRKSTILSVLLLLVSFFSYSQFPSVYDLRTLGLITSVKDQGGSCGSCWAFASSAAIESQWLKQGYGTYDLSEDNIIDCHGFDEAPCAGGSYYMTQALLSYHLGILSEIDDAYSPSVQNCPYSFTFPPQQQAFVEDMWFIPSAVNDVKQAVTDYGAVATTMFFNMLNYNSSQYKYYDSFIDSNDSLYAHCVTIAGWNDTMQFAGAPMPGGWIIKDSYGTSWAQNGYFYCSYYDAGILGDNVIFPKRYNIPALSNMPHVYAHDRLGWVDNYGYSSNVAWGLVKYTLQPSGGVVTPQQIKRIGTYAVVENTVIDFSLWRNKSGNTLSGLIGNWSINCPYKGFYTLPINIKTDSLNSDIFIEVRYACPAGVLSPIPVESFETGHTSGFSVSTGACWVSADGNVWNPVGGGTGSQFDLCIKMYTENAPMTVMDALPDSVCEGTMLMLNDLTPMPKDSCRWLVNQTYVGSAFSLPYVSNNQGLNEIMLVTFLGNNSDTLIHNLYVIPNPPVPSVVQIGNTLQSSAASSYQWLDNLMNPISGAVFQTYDPTFEGYYYVTVYNEYGCQSTSNPFDFHFANIFEPVKHSISVFPNPADEVMMIRFSDNMNISVVEMIDITGKTFSLNPVLTGNCYQYFDVSNLNSGIYILRISTLSFNELFIQYIIIQ